MSAWPRALARRRRGLVALVGVALGSLLLSACFGAGFYSVGNPLTSTQLPPGLWRSLGGNQCTWTRVQSGSPSMAGKNTRTDGPQYVQIEPSDLGIAIGNCFPFWQHPGAFARPVVQPGSPFGDGDFLVGYEVAPGYYRATSPPGQRCTWAVVRGFHGNNAAGNNPDFVRGNTTSAGSPLVQISAGDYGFTSQGCGQWRVTSAPPPPPPTTTTPPPPPDPIFHVTSEDFPDPFVLRVDDAARCGGDPAPCYYAYSTEAGLFGLLNVPVIRSTDLVNWKWAGPPASGSTAARRDAMPTLASWVSFGFNWAPSVMWNSTANKYVMYYTAKSTSLDRQCIGMATSTAPDGPFVDDSTQPFLCPNGAGDTIDPSPFVDSGGGLWLQYADQSAIRTRQLNPNGTLVSGSPTQLLVTSQPWEAGRVEAPSTVQTPDTGIVLFYSGNVFDNPGYAVGAARCSSASAGCALISNSPILSSSQGPGGQSPFQLVSGSWKIAYHAWSGTVGSSKRTLHISNMTFSGTAPTKNPSIP